MYLFSNHLIPSSPPNSNNANRNKFAHPNLPAHNRQSTFCVADNRLFGARLSVIKIPGVWGSHYCYCIWFLVRNFIKTKTFQIMPLYIIDNLLLCWTHTYFIVYLFIYFRCKISFHNTLVYIKNCSEQKADSNIACKLLIVC